MAVSERTPTYYDFCIGDKNCNACCFDARKTFAGVTHSGDLTNQMDLLHFIKMDVDQLIERELAVFISGFQYTKLTRFLGSNPAVLIANNIEKVYILVSFLSSYHIKFWA